MGVHASAGHGDRFFSDFAPSRRYTPRQQRQQNLRPSFLRSLAVTGAPGLIHSGLFIAHFRSTRHPGAIGRKHIAGLANTDQVGLPPEWARESVGLGANGVAGEKGLFSPGMGKC